MAATPRHLCITGAAGFLGRATVAAALEQGHRVTALVRARPVEAGRVKEVFPDEAMLGVVELDLADDSAAAAARLRDALSGVDAVLHLAARMSGDDEQHAAYTVEPTRRLLNAAQHAEVRRFVLVSSLSVYGYWALDAGATLNEDTPLETRPHYRDAYCRAKLAQERVVCEAVGDVNPHFRAVIVRPGVIAGPGRWWTARLGRQVAGGWLRFGGRAAVPLIHVDHAAAALVAAAVRDDAAGQTINLIESDPPIQSNFAAALRPVLNPKWSVTIPWPLLRVIGAAASGMHRVVLRGKGRLPGVLVPESLHAQLKPLCYDNAVMRQTLGDPGPIDWAVAVRAADGADNPAAAPPDPATDTGTAA